MTRLGFVICVILAIGLAGCGTVKNTAGWVAGARAGTCPRVTILADAADVVQFNGPGRDLPDIQYQARVTNVRTACSYHRSRGQRYARSSVNISFTAELGSVAFPAPASIPYFVALVRPSTEEVLTKEVYMLNVAFDAEPSVVLEDSIDRISIPVQNTTEGGDYEIVVGFELTPEQVEFNRRRDY